MTSTEAAKHVRENIARVKSYLRRNELIRTLETLAETLIYYSKLKVVGSVRFELEVGLDEALAEVSRQPAVQELVPKAGGKPVVLRYVKGKEAAFATALTAVAHALQQAAREEEEAQLRKLNEHRDHLLTSGQECLDIGDYARARVFFARCADEFGQEPGLLTSIAERFRAKELFVEEAEMHLRAMDVFPKEPAHYAALIDCYVALQEFEKAEKTYEQVNRHFGLHPRTLYNMAKFYLSWHKKDKAAATAYRAVQLDSSFTEAQELLDWLDGKRS